MAFVDALNDFDAHGVLSHSIVATVTMIDIFDVNHLLAVTTSTLLGIISQVIIFFIKKTLNKPDYAQKDSGDKKTDN